jgi:Putative transmembrane protein (PGPGW)
MLEWIKGYQTLILFMTFVSIVTFIATLIAVPWLIVRIPSNYFSKRRRITKLWADEHPVVRAVLLTIKNLVGYFLIAAGIIMLAIPGQGLLTILIGIIFLDLPGKYRFERWLVTRPAVLRSINWLRRRARKAPLVLK